MPTTISGREFNHDTSRAKKAALSGPVFITDRGKSAQFCYVSKNIGD